MIIGGTNPGRFQAAAEVLARDGYLHFRGTDDAVWRVCATDPADHTNFGGPDTVSTSSNVYPADDGYLYFRGTDGLAWRLNATTPADRGTPGDLVARSGVYARDGYMYFQGEQHAVWRVNASDPDDRTDFGGPGVVAAKSCVYPADDGYLYFRARDNRVWRVRSDGGASAGGASADGASADGASAGGASAGAGPVDGGPVGDFESRSDVFARDGYAYFRGTDNAVWRVNASDPGECTNFGGPRVVGTLSSVYPADDGYLYFRGTDGLAWRLNATTPADRGTPGDLAARSGVFADHGCMYFQGKNFLVWRYALTGGTLADYTTAAVVTLQNWYDRKAGLWNPRLFESGWWNSANALYALIDYMSLTGTTSYLHVAENTFDRNRGDGFLNDYYDDEGWWALAWINAYDLLTGLAPEQHAAQTRRQDYLNMAKAIFADMEEGWDPATCDGGVLWKKRTRIKNSIENELFLAVAARLYQRVPGPEKAHYLGWLQRAGKWFYDKFAESDPRHLIYDGLIAAPRSGSHAGHEQTYTYNQGVIVGALTDMAASGLDFAGHEPIGVATRIADAALRYLTQDGVLTEFGNPEAGRSPDLPQFKGIFMRNLGLLAAYLGPGGNATYVDFIRRNVTAVLTSGRTSANQFGYRWQGPFDKADSTRQTSAIEALNAALRVGITSAG